MNNLSIGDAVEEFAAVTQGFTDADLENTWIWQEYDEGVRFAFFRTYEELRELAARLGSWRSASGIPMTVAQRSLAQYHLAYRDLQAVLLGLSETDARRAPSQQEWSVMSVLMHVIQAERGFLAITSHSLKCARSDSELPEEMSEEDWAAFWEGDRFQLIKESATLAGLMDYYQSLHDRLLGSFCTVSDAELSAPSTYWEDTPKPVAFRLHRFDSHLRQHTIQIEKTLPLLGIATTEARRLLRLIYNALAQAEGYAIGVDPMEHGSLGSQVTQRGAELAEIVSSATTKTAPE